MRAEQRARFAKVVLRVMPTRCEGIVDFQLEHSLATSKSHIRIAATNWLQ